MKKHIEKFKSLEKGQKIKLLIVVILIIIILYMLSGFFSGGSSSNYTPAPNNNSVSQIPVQRQPAITVEQKQTIATSGVTVTDLTAKQMAYLKAVNELQMLQLQQQIAQSKQQIAQAELQTAQADKQRESITTPPPPPIFNNINPQQQSAVVIPNTPNAYQYQLEYIANEGGKWQVIISNNGTLINATLGTMLPDGSKITDISGTSVTLISNGHAKILTIAPSY